MTQEQADRFFERIPRLNKITVTTPDREFPLFELNMPKMVKQMFLALVESTIYLEELSTGKLSTAIMTHYNYKKSVDAIESASGLPWSEVRGIYKECFG
jgi:hypothetical protein